MRRSALAAVIAAAVPAAAAPPAPRTPKVTLPSLRVQAGVRDLWIEEREQRRLGPLMREAGVEFWILSQKEYAEDTAWRSVASPLRINARRRTTIVYQLGTDGHVTRHEFIGFGDLNIPQVQGVVGAGSGLIAINRDEDSAFADGLGSGELEWLQKGLGADAARRLVSRPTIGIQFVALRVPAQLTPYREMMMQVWRMIETAMSSEVITPGVTTCADVQWWIREHIASLGHRPGFHPSFSLQRNGVTAKANATRRLKYAPTPKDGSGCAQNWTGDLDGDTVIQRGDLLWCDVGFIAYELWTDTQHMGYVLREGETEPPQGLLAGLRTSMRMQDILLDELTPGKTGNAILAASTARMQQEGIDGLFYTHPIGDHMHGAGAAIGMFDNHNQPVPLKGEIEVRAPTWFSIELSATVAVPEWGGQRVTFRQEEDATLGGTGNQGDDHAEFIFDRQEAYHIVA